MYAMNTVATVSVTGKFSSSESEKADKLFAAVEETLKEIDASLSATSETSCTSRFNAAPAGEVEVDGHFYGVMQTALEVFGKTGGAYNPAVYDCVRAYGFNLGGAKKPEVMPTDEQIGEYGKIYAEFGNIEICQKDGKYIAVKPVDGLKVDFGGIGKGYAVDKVSELIKQYGFTCGYFDFGGSSIYCLEHAENGEYSFSFTHPRGGEDYMTADVKNTSVTTSGDYENYYEVDGVRYCHIIDPATGKPVGVESGKNIMSASVIGGKAAENDAYATAVMAMQTEEAKEFIKTVLCDRIAFFSYLDGGNLKAATNDTQGVLKSPFGVEYVL